MGAQGNAVPRSKNFPGLDIKISDELQDQVQLSVKDDKSCGVPCILRPSTKIQIVRQRRGIPDPKDKNNNRYNKPKEKVTGPGQTNTSGPQKTSISGIEQTNASGPGPTNASRPGPTNASGPGPTNTSGPGPTNASGLPQKNISGPGEANAFGPGQANTSGPGQTNTSGPVLNTSVETNKPAQKNIPDQIQQQKVVKLQAVGPQGNKPNPIPNAAVYNEQPKSSALTHGALSFDPNRIYNFGERGSGFITKGEPQVYNTLLKTHLNAGTLFEDTEFPAIKESLGYERAIVWKRPPEMKNNPELFVEGGTRFDVQQGELGDCWLLAAIANLTIYPHLLKQVIPDGQSFKQQTYAGIFHFRIWQFGRWIDVVVDDRLPTVKGKLVFLHSSQENEFWSALLEKAYAKLCGSYYKLQGGATSEAMEDFTGGVTEMFNLKSNIPKLFQMLKKAYERSSLMGCSIEADTVNFEAVTPEGLVRGHAYSITGLRQANVSGNNVQLVRVRNPWGNETEWKGPWSDQSKEWKLLSNEEKRRMEINFENDGEFYMSIEDFVTYFDRLEICHLDPNNIGVQSTKTNRTWNVTIFEGAWVKGVTAGGCRNYLPTFIHNPQYLITLVDPDESDDDDTCTIIIALMQKCRKKNANDVILGFVVYRIKDPKNVPKPLDRKWFKLNASVAKCEAFINLRENSNRFKLPPGTYCIIPSSYEPGEEAEYILRVFTETSNIAKEHDHCLTYYYPELDSVNEDEVVKYFSRVSGGQDVNYIVLADVLTFAHRHRRIPTPFSNEACRIMLVLMDLDKSGTMSLEEFKLLWSEIKFWQTIFEQFDKNKSASLSGFELRQAFNHAGYAVNTRLLNAIVHRYGTKQNELQYEDFIRCAIKLKLMIDMFKEMCPRGSDIASCNIDQWLENTICT